MLNLKELRCAVCGQKLAEYDFPAGQVRIICHRTKCKTMNVMIVRDREMDGKQNILINLTQKHKNVL